MIVSIDMCCYPAIQYDIISLTTSPLSTIDFFLSIQCIKRLNRDCSVVVEIINQESVFYLEEESENTSADCRYDR